MTRRGRAAARLLAVALLAGSAFSFRAAFAGLDTAPPPEASDRSSPSPTPLWSARRLPALVVDAAAGPRLQATLDGIAAPYDACVVVGRGGQELAAHGGESALAPASTEKLLTATAALSVLGPDHRFETRAVAGAPLGPGGVVAGDLYLVGGGDPLLATPGYAAYLAGSPRSRLDPVTALGELADRLVAAGLRRVEGRVLGDDSRYETLRYLPSWKPSYRTQGDIGPLGALVVDDGFTSWSPRIPAADPAVHAAGELTELLAQRGVVVAGGAGRGTAPPAATAVATIASVSLARIVEGMLTSSDNMTAELLTREVGLVRAGSGTSAAGATAVVEADRRAGVAVDGVRLFDGSGLSPDDRATCRALVGAVALGDRERYGALRSGLAVAGSTGTLAQRFVGHPLAGRLRAKTGQIAGVVGFAGVVEGEGGEPTLTFAFIANGGFSTAEGWALQQRVAEAVDAYPAVPGAAELVPAPGAR